MRPAATPADRPSAAPTAHDQHQAAVAALEAAMRAYTGDVNALPVPELMQGPVVAVTDLDSLSKVGAVLAMGTRGSVENDRLYRQVADYRARRLEIAQRHKIDDLAEAVVRAAAAHAADLAAKYGAGKVQS
jgi:hypothetical protein